MILTTTKSYESRIECVQIDNNDDDYSTCVNNEKKDFKLIQRKRWRFSMRFSTKMSVLTLNHRMIHREQWRKCLWNMFFKMKCCVQQRQIWWMIKWLSYELFDVKWSIQIDLTKTFKSTCFLFEINLIIEFAVIKDRDVKSLIVDLKYEMMRVWRMRMSKEKAKCKLFCMKMKLENLNLSWNLI